MTRPAILVSNLMMLKERDRFDKAIRVIGAEPIWPEVAQYMSEASCMKWAGKIDAWAAGDDRISRAVLKAHLPRLRGIAKWGTGLDSIDLDAAAELGVSVRNTPAAFSNAVSEVALAYMLMLTRNVAMVDAEVRTGGWPKPKGPGLSGRILGQIGFGAIGQGIALRAQACGMEVVAYDPPMQHLGSHAGARLVVLEELLEIADVVAIACNLTPENYHLIDEAALARMKHDAILVNVARGPVVDEAALVSALQAGRIAGAGLDVFEVEPLPTKSPLVSMKNVVLGSHNANNQHAAVEAVHANTMKNLAEMIAPLVS